MFKAAFARTHHHLIHTRRNVRLACAVLSILPPSGKVLDVGCGNGWLAKSLADARPALSIEGVDVLAWKDAHIPVRLFDGHSLPFDDKMFDTVCILDVLHHTENPIELLKEAARVTRNTIIVKDHIAETSLDHATLSVMDWVSNAPHGVALPYNYFSQSEWDAAFTGVGFSPEAMLHDLHLYPRAIDWIFGRGLHFIARLSNSRASTRS